MKALTDAVRYARNRLAAPIFFLALFCTMKIGGEIEDRALDSRVREYGQLNALPSEQAQKLIQLVEYARFRLSEDRTGIEMLFFICFALSLLRLKLTKPDALSQGPNDGLLTFLFFLIVAVASSGSSESACLYIHRAVEGRAYEEWVGLNSDQTRRLAIDLAYPLRQRSRTVVGLHEGVLAVGLILSAARWVWIASRSRKPTLETE
jgi:hypothetical protein